MWPDLAKFHHFAKYLKIFVNIFKVYFVLGIGFNSLWHNLYAFGQIFIYVNGQILKTQSDHLVTLQSNPTTANCRRERESPQTKSGRRKSRPQDGDTKMRQRAQHRQEVGWPCGPRRQPAWWRSGQPAGSSLPSTWWKWQAVVSAFSRIQAGSTGKSESGFATSVTRSLDYVFNFGHLQQWKFTIMHTLCCQSWFKILPKTTPTKIGSLVKNLPKWRNFAKFGHTDCNSGNVPWKSNRSSCFVCLVYTGWPDWAIYRHLGDFLKHTATIILAQIAQIFGNFFGDFWKMAQILIFYVV